MDWGCNPSLFELSADGADRGDDDVPRNRSRQAGRGQDRSRDGFRWGACGWDLTPTTSFLRNRLKNIS